MSHVVRKPSDVNFTRKELNIIDSVFSSVPAFRVGSESERLRQSILLKTKSVPATGSASSDC